MSEFTKGLKLPIAFRKSGEGPTEDVGDLVDGDGAWVADCILRSEADPIVRAVNNHEGLLAALKAIVEIEEGPGETDRPHMIAARAAIQRAEEQK